MKTYLIIGASSGIGKKLAENLSNHSQVFATYKTKSISSSSINYQYYDVLENNQLQNISQVLDGIVYCPGLINLKPFAKLNVEDFLNDYKIQVGGAIQVIQQVLPNLKKSESASIVLFSTIAVQTGFNFHSLVASSKGAIEGLTKALAAEFAPKIRVNCVAPSITNTPLAHQLLSNEEKIKANADRHPLKRVGQAEDIAQLTEFLLTEKSTWITGQVLHVDGGLSTLK